MQSLTLGVGMGLVLLLGIQSIEGGWSTVWEVGHRYDKFAMFDLDLDTSRSGGSLFAAITINPSVTIISDPNCIV